MTDNEPTRSRRIPFCGSLSVIAPFLGYIALEIILPCFEDGRNWSWRLFLDGGPTWLRGVGHTILGAAGLVGFVLACVALWRAENPVLAVLGLLLNFPLIFLLTGLADWVPILPELLEPAPPKGLPVPR